MIKWLDQKWATSRSFRFWFIWIFLIVLSLISAGISRVVLTLLIRLMGVEFAGPVLFGLFYISTAIGILASGVFAYFKSRIK